MLAEPGKGFEVGAEAYENAPFPWNPPLQRAFNKLAIISDSDPSDLRRCIRPVKFPVIN